MSGTDRGKTAIVRDARYLEHMPGITHPEHPNRLMAVYEMLDADFGDELCRIVPEPATLEQLELVHTPTYIEKVLKSAELKTTSLAPDTPVSEKSYLSAWLAVGGCIKGIEAVTAGEFRSCFALVRPPGHHALPDRAGGFCIFNNLGIAARYALKHLSTNRILLIDWDVHHGNGLSQLFYEEARVFYFSTHDVMLYPYTGTWEDVGQGKGKGYTLNVPVPRDLTDEEMLTVYQSLLGEVMRAYSPELVLIGAGFDAHGEDSVGKSRLTEKFFRWITHYLVRITEHTGCPMLLALEGGYNPRYLALCVKEVLTVLLGASFNGDIPVCESPRVRTIVEKTRRIHAEYSVWTA
jgi:acetoin utilization deacetylase AcuC-like enzyme